MNNSVKAFLHRGAFGTINNGLKTFSFSLGSRGFFTFRRTNRKTWFATTVVIYNSDPDTEVTLRLGKDSIPLKKIYVKPSFPYISLRNANADAYKSINLAIGRRVFNQSQAQIVIKTARFEETVAFLGFGEPDTAASSLKLKQKAEAVRADSEDSFLADPDLINLDLSIGERLETTKDRQELFELSQARASVWVKARANHRRAFQISKQLKEDYRQESDALALFWQELDEVIAPLTLGRHGYYPNLKTLDLAVVEQELSSLVSLLNQLGLEVILNSGTLLGYVRDGRPIPHDDDFDLALLLSGDTPLDCAEKWKSSVAKIKNEINVVFKGPFIATNLACGLQVDIFPAWETEGRFFIYPYCFGDVTPDVVKPVKSLAVRNQMLPFPNKPEELLCVNYGPNWKTPDPFWSFDFNAARRRFGPILKKFKLRAAL